MNRVILGVCLAVGFIFTQSSYAFAQKIFIEQEGQVVIESETFSSRTASDTHEWLTVPEEITGFPSEFTNYRGEGYVQVQPEGFGGSSPLAPPFIDYTVRINTPGTYRLYVRWVGPNNDSDTFYASIAELSDGSGGATADWYRYIRISEAPDFAAPPTWFGSGGFERTDSPFSNGETPVIWPISVAGDYTIRLSMREDGVAIDAFVFQLANLPAPTGDGPPASPIHEDLTIATPSISSVRFGQFFSHELEAISGEPPYSWSIVEGVLPSGVDLSPDGVLSGTPPEAGEFNFTVTVEDSSRNFAEKSFTLKILATLPPPDVRIHLTGSTPVPGRTLAYFASLENLSSVQAADITIYAILEPYLTLDLASPIPVITGELDGITLIEWSHLTLAPSERKFVSYTAKLDPAFPISSPVTQFLCANFNEENSSSACFEDCRNHNFKGFPTNIFGGVCNSILKNYCNCRCNGKPESSCDQTNIIPFICGEFDYTPSQRISVLATPVITNTIPLETSICESRPDPATAPIDPNEKLVTAKRFVQPNQLLVYPIHFENIGNVEALDVFVTDILDSNLDASTLEILTPEGASYDDTTRTIKWELIGRNLQPGETGNVLLSIRPLPGLPSGTEIRNEAEIQFDIFDPLVTPEVVNIIDSTAPNCTIDALPEESSAPFTISWSGTDAPGEVDTYTIFMSEDGGGHTPFLQGTSETNTIFEGDVGKVYQFICIATDTAGNTEVQDPEAEAITHVTQLAPIPTSIDIKPGSDPNSINLKSKGVIPVAILTTDNFDATTVDPLSITFGSGGAAEAHGQGHIEDVDRDGDHDMVFHFRTQETSIQCGDTEVSLTGMTVGGQEIEGNDSIQTVGCQ